MGVKVLHRALAIIELGSQRPDSAGRMCPRVFMRHERLEAGNSVVKPLMEVARGREWNFAPSRLDAPVSISETSLSRETGAAHRGIDFSFRRRYYLTFFPRREFRLH